MESSGKQWRRVGLGVARVAVVLLGATRGGAESSRALIRVDDPQTAIALRWAIDGAHEWLGHGGCGEVFADFRDLAGKPLSDVLSERGESGQEHLGRLFFYDGSGRKACDGRGSAAVTMPGSHIVFICPASFRELAREPRQARAVIIHELLHSLGLGENPPSSREITARVNERCWQ